MTSIFSNVYLWMGGTFLFLIISIVSGFLSTLFMTKTHAIAELKASFGKKVLGHFYTDESTYIVKAIKAEAGVIQDKDMGTFMINPRASYIDERLRTPVYVFDSNFGCSVDVSAAKLAESLGDIAKDTDRLSELKSAVLGGKFGDDETVKILSSNVKVGKLKEMMDAIMPHQISSLVQMLVARRIKALNKPVNGQIILAVLAGAGCVAIPMLLMKLLG